MTVFRGVPPHGLEEHSNTEGTLADGQVWVWQDSSQTYVPADIAVGADEQNVLVSATDTAAAFLDEKVVAGTGVTINNIVGASGEALEIVADAAVIPDTDLALGTSTSTTLEVTSSTGTNVTLPAATTLAAGLFEGTDKTKLNGVETAATADQLAAEVPVSTTPANYVPATSDVEGHLAGIDTALAPASPQRAVYVDVNGSDTTGNGTFLSPYETIAKGITEAKLITNFDISVVVGQGTYPIANPLEIPNNIILRGWDTEGFFPTPTDTGQDLFTVGTTDPDAEVVFVNMRINAAAAATSMVRQDGVDSRVFAKGCSMRNSTGIGWDCRAGVMVLNDMESSDNDSNNTVYKVSGTGKMTIGQNTASDSDITTVFLCDGADLDVAGPTLIDTVSSTVGTAISVDNGGSVNFQNALIRGATTGINLDNASSCEMIGVLFEEETTSINVVDLASTVKFVGSSLSKNMISFPAGYTNENMLFQDSTEDEEAIKIFGDLFVGRAEHGTLLCTGQGEPTTRGLLVLTSDGTATSTTEGGNITDETAAASSFSGSTFGFQGTTANHTVMMACTLEATAGVHLQHPGVFIAQNAAAVEVTPKSFVFEYWNGAAWAEITTMSIEADNSYRYGNEVFIRSGSREHIRYNNDILADWALKTINGEEQYWSRIRIDTTVTTAPTFHQFRLHPNYGEFAQDGYGRFYGSARFRETLLAAGNVYSETGSVVSFTLPIGGGGIPTGWTHQGNNQQMDSTGDAIYFQFILPKGIDTSNPLNVSMYYIPEQAGASTDASVIISALPIEAQGVLEADPSGGSVPVARTLANTKAVTDDQGQATTISTPIVDNTKIQQISSDPIDISDFYEGDMVFIRIEYDSHGSALKDLFILSVELDGASWALGGRL